MIRSPGPGSRKTSKFTLQWHLTNQCPFLCRHCYDRTDRTALSLEAATAVIRNLIEFCRHKKVGPQISLSGGDPLCYPHFWDIYRKIQHTKIPVSILGNPIPAEVIKRLLEIRAPIAYQVSLEGFEDHNDSIRGSGHFKKVMAFLAKSRALGLNTHVMLTLTEANLDQVIALGEHLRGWTTRFTFNRLSQVGNGADLKTPSKERFIQFLNEYLQAAQRNPILGLKENLLSVVRDQQGKVPLPGCTGFGCGAAFNFVALLPDGEVHACRKYPSPIGNITSQSLLAICDSPQAEAHRQGPAACRNCRLKPHCGGCQAVIHGQGLDPQTDKDPFCFL